MLDLAEGVAELFLDAQAITIESVRYRWVDSLIKRSEANKVHQATYRERHRAEINARKRATKRAYAEKKRAARAPYWHERRRQLKAAKAAKAAREAT